MGVIEKDQREAMSILELENEIRKGTLLCKIADIMCPNKVNGTFRNPKTNATALMNISKALNSLRSLPRISLKYIIVIK